MTLLFFLISLAFGCGNGGAKAEVDDAADARTKTTYVLVRHAEKDTGADPDLTPAGMERANALASRLRSANLAAVYSTDTQRTQSTARPTAQMHGLRVISYDASNPAAMAKSLEGKYPGKTVLIVGHSQSTGKLANAISGTTKFPAISEDDFENIFEVDVNARGKVKTRLLKY